MSDTKFTHLHVHSHYSLLEAIPKLDVLIEAAKADGQSALALTDQGNLYGAIEFYKDCTKAGIKPIIGVDLFIAQRTMADMEHNKDDASTRLVLLARNNEGYHNIIKIVSETYTDGFFLRPRADHALLKKYSAGITCIVPAIESDARRAIQDSESRARDCLLAWKNIFGKHTYLEISHHPEIENHTRYQQRLIAVAEELQIPLVAAQEISYMKKEDGLARELVDCIREGKVLNRDLEDGLADFSFKTREEMISNFKKYPQAIENAQKIADECSVVLTLGKAIFPQFPLEEGKTDNMMLREQATAGIKLRGMEPTKELLARMDYELGIIEKKGYASYFLIVADLMRFAKSAGIYTNTRGSAAGSLVSYLCHITAVDPIVFNMPFERFLNPERPTAPDIDMDIADNRRDDLIAYAREKYGDDHVVQIGTFGTMMARAAVRDVSRALGHSYGTGDALAKMIPFGKQGFPVTLDGALDEVPELKTAYKKDPVSREILDMAKKIEGNARHVGVHAAGVVIAPSPVMDLVPVQPDPKGGKTITQYDMYSVADEYGGVGLLKFDFLGLTNLSVLADAVGRVSVRLHTTVDLDRIPQDDKKVYDMLTRGETLGVFQMASSGMTAYLMELRSNSVNDLNAMVALYRPGPMAFIPEYIKRKQNPNLVKYLDPRLESILKPTYGVLIYQDDVMMMAVQLAGYSWGDADKFRKAMGKKIPEEMQAQKQKFITGCIERKMRPAAADALWQQIETFAAYGFNKAHAASYGNLAYKTAYMKANFPVDYMAAVLTADAGDVEKIWEIIAECRRLKLTVLPPSVNESLGNFSVVDNKTIRFGLYSIKNFGTGVADNIVVARKDGKFKSVVDFLTRVADKNLNKRQLESLIYSGALDEFDTRGKLLANLEAMLAFHKDSTAAPSEQASLFGASTATAQLTLNDAPDLAQEEKLKWEKELLGLYVSGHPLDKHRELLEKQKMPIARAKEGFPKGVQTVIGGYLEDVRTLLTKKGDRMAFIKISDFTGSIEAVIFPEAFEVYGKFLETGSCVLLKGAFNARNGDTSFIAERVKKL